MAKVLILYCEEGEGHASAARALAAELAARGAEVDVVDALRDGLGRVIPWFTRDAYRVQVRWLRWTYGVEFFLFTRVGPLRAVARRGLALLARRPLLRLVARHAPEVIVSTHPSVTNVLGHLRRRGRLAVPTVATITDFGVHPLWSHPGIDLHLVLHEQLRARVERVAGVGRTAIVGPLVGAGFRPGRSRAAARAALGLPVDGPVVVVSGGGWGVGDLAGAAEAALRLPRTTVVCLAGKNELLQRRLERRLGEEPRVVVLPFTDRMADVLAAADALVDSTVGVTCLEAIGVGCPVVLFGSPPGHSRENAKAIAALGLAASARSEEELSETLRRVVGGDRPAGALAPAASAAAAVLAARAQAAPPRRRRAAAMVAVAAAGVLTLSGWGVSTPASYPVLARAFDLDGVRSVDTPTPQVALLVASGPRRIPTLARLLSARGARASFVVSQVPSAGVRRVVRARGDGFVPAPAPSGLPGAAAVVYRTRLRRLARSCGLGAPFFFVRPSAGFTLGDYLAARLLGGHLASPTPLAARARRLRLQSGQLIEVDATRSAGALLALVRALEAAGLRAVPLDELVASAASTRATAGARAMLAAPAVASAIPAASAASRSGDAGQRSPASSGAAATGTTVVTAKTSGAT